MEVSLKDRITIRRYIEAIPTAEWVARARVLNTEAAQAYTAGEIDDDIYEVWSKEIASRLERHAQKASEHGRSGGEGSTALNVGSMVSEFVATIPMPRPSMPRPSMHEPEGRNVRGPARHTAEERFQRRLKSREQAGMAKLPASIKRYFTMSQLSAFSVIIHRASKHAGICVLAVGSIAGISAVSARTVQNAVAIGKRAKLITVHEQEGAPNIIRIVDPRILERLPDSRDVPYPSLPKTRNSSIISDTKSPRMGANLCLNDKTESLKVEPLATLDHHHTPKVARALLEPVLVPVAPVQDEAEEIRQEAVQKGIVEMEMVEVQFKPGSPLEAALAALGAMVEARNAPS